MRWSKHKGAGRTVVAGIVVKWNQQKWQIGRDRSGALRKSHPRHLCMLITSCYVGEIDLGEAVVAAGHVRAVAKYHNMYIDRKNLPNCGS